MKRVLTIDDLDGQSIDAALVEFEVDGVPFEIDLTEAHALELHMVQEQQAEALRQALLPYVKAGRRQGGGRLPDALRAALGDDVPPVTAGPSAVLRRHPGGRIYRPKLTPEERQQCRDWAAQQGTPVTGERIPSSIRDAWEAHRKEQRAA